MFAARERAKEQVIDTEATGIASLDYITRGLPPNALTMVIGAPGTGKTVLTVQMAVEAAREGRDVIFLSVYSEPHEKLIEHMKSFSFFDPSLIGQKIELLSLQGVITEGAEATLETILKTARGKQEPLIILDGYQGLRNVMGPEAAQALLAALSGQLPYLHASALIASEFSSEDTEHYSELAAGDVIIALSNRTVGGLRHRTIEVLKMRGHPYQEGPHALSFSEEGVMIYPRLATCFPASPPEPTSHRQGFDLPQFDQMLGGGLPEFSTTVIFGDLGTGKTTLGLHYLIAGSRVNEPGLMVTFREAAPDLMKMGDNLGLDLRSPITAGQIQVLRVPPVEVNAHEVAWRIGAIVDQLGIKRLVIDGVSELERAARILGSPADYMAALREKVWRSGTTTVMTRDGVPQRPDMNDVPAVAIAQNRVVLRRVAYRLNLHRVCSVLNMQASEHDTSIREFRIGQGGIHVMEASQSDPGVLAGIAEAQQIL